MVQSSNIDVPLLVVAVPLFLVATACTVSMSGAMSSAMAMPMPGGWKMSMEWVGMPGQAFLSANASFLRQWVVMMMAMMLPCLFLMLRAYRVEARRHTWTVGAAYFLVWCVFGEISFLLGNALVRIEMGSPALTRLVPMAAGMVVAGAGALQFTAWKSRYLQRCSRSDCANASFDSRMAAGKYGLRLGADCVFCCLSFMLILLVTGVMDVGFMFILAGALTLERLWPNRVWLTRAFGLLMLLFGLWLVAVGFRAA